METTTITMIAILVVIALLLVWLSLSMAATEGAVGRVTRASLNNLILEIQTDTEASQFIRDKKIKRIHKVQRLIADRYATAGSCAFFRITCNVLDGVLVAAIASLCDAPLWAGLLVGFVFALVVAVISLLVRPRSAGASKPVDLMLKHADAASVAVALTPFAKIGGQKDAKRHSNDLSDDEELEKIQLEQGRATIDRLVEANDFDPEVSEMLRNVLTLSETLTREIMVPRTDMICIERGETLENMLKLCSRSGFSRIPVIGDDVDDLVGVAYLKDAVRATAFNPAAISRDVESIVRDPMLVPESKPVDDLFHQMQRTRQHVAIVVDEYGGIAGGHHRRHHRTDRRRTGGRARPYPACRSGTNRREQMEHAGTHAHRRLGGDLRNRHRRGRRRHGIRSAHQAAWPRADRRFDGRHEGLRLTAVDSAGRRESVHHRGGTGPRRGRGRN